MTAEVSVRTESMNSNARSSAEKPTQEGRSGRRRSKSPRRSSSTKQSPTKAATGNSQRTPKNQCQLNGTPPNHVSSLLLSKTLSNADSSGGESPFLSTLDSVGILSELVLSIPACGAAVHRFKPAKGFTVQNAISGCPDSPQTAVSFFLHKLLPQPRTSLKKDLEKAKATDNSQKTQEHDKTKMAHSAARLMVCPRSGKGRRKSSLIWYSLELWSDLPRQQFWICRNASTRGD